MVNLVCVATISAIAICLLVRSNSVYDFRVYLIRIVYSFSDLEWRVKVLDQVSSNIMLFRFWKPLKPEDWWASTDFLR